MGVWQGKMSFLRVGMGAILGITSLSWGDSTSKDLLVRYRVPQNHSNQTRRVTQMAVGGLPFDISILNQSEGLVQLSFATEYEMEMARERLFHSPEVLNVTQNYLYRPSFWLSPSHFKKMNFSVEIKKKNHFFRILPFPDPRNHFLDLPEVGLSSSFFQEGPDPLASQDWAWENIHMPQLSANDLAKAQKVTVAVIDTGVDYNHEDLIGAMWRHPSTPLEVGYDFVHEHSRPYDVVQYDLAGCLKNANCKIGINVEAFLSNPGHGTHCAGHIGAVAQNGLGIRGIGSPAKVQIMALKFIHDAGEENAGRAEDAAAIRSIDYAIQNGAKVISASWGSRMDRHSAENSELKKALIRAQQAGVLVVTAAGNEGIDQDTYRFPTFPASYDLDNLIVVAAHDPSYELSNFSNFGLKTVHISAPGTKVFSTIPGNRYGDVMASYFDDHEIFQEITWDGTSMAAPVVAGAVALVWSMHPEENYHQIRNRILRSARKIPSLIGKIATGGVLDVSAALELDVSETLKVF